MNKAEFLDALESDPAFAAGVAAALAGHLRVDVTLSARPRNYWDSGSETEYEASADLHAITPQETP